MEQTTKLLNISSLQFRSLFQDFVIACPEIAGHGRQFSVIFPYTKWRAFYRALMEF